MELLEALYKSRLLYRDLRLFGDSTHFMFILQTTVDETRSGTPGLCTPHLCQVNKGRGATEGRAAVGSGALFSRLEIKLTFQPPENSKALSEVAELGWGKQLRAFPPAPITLSTTQGSR